MTSKHPVFSVELSFGWRRIPFVSFISRAHFKAQVMVRREKPGNLLKAHVGHMDNRGRIQTSRKCFERENRHWPYQRSSTYSAILFFPVESTEKGLHVFHDRNQNFRFPFLKTETPALYPKRPAARNWRLCFALCWLFDVKRFVTRGLLSLILTPTDPSDDY